MKNFCEHYIPNNRDYLPPRGYCLLRNCSCEFRGQYPEYNYDNADQQKQCPDYKEWQDPLLKG